MATTAGGPSGPDINIKVKTMAPATHELCISPQVDALCACIQLAEAGTC